MKTIFQIFFIVFITISALFTPLQLLATEPVSSSVYILKVKKGKQSKAYKVRDYVRIVYFNANNEKQVTKGILYAISKDSVFVKPFQKKLTPVAIPLDNISSVQKLYVRGRMNWKLFAAFMLGLIIFFTIREAGAVATSTLPSGSLLLVIITYFFSNLLTDIISKKSKRKGWQFSIEESR